MKIAYLVAEFPSVSQTFVQNQIIGILERGHDVTIFSLCQKDDVLVNQEFLKHNLLAHTDYLNIPRNKMVRVIWGVILVARYIRKYPLPIMRSLNGVKYGKKALSLSLLYQIIPFLEKGPYDILHCQFGDLGFEGLCLKQVLGGISKLVISFRGYDATKDLRRDPERYEKLFEAGDLFLPVSHFLKDLITHHGCHEEKTVVLRSGVDCEKFTYSTKHAPIDKPVNVITVGRLVEKKGIVYAIEAVSQVLKSGRRMNYTIVGEGLLRDELERVIKNLGLEGVVRLIGGKSHEEVVCILRESHVFLAPSVTAQNGDQEGIPNVLKEAMAMGLPVISTWHSGIPELVEDEVSGFLVEERNVVALADRLQYLIDHPESWSQMGKAGRLRVEQDFNDKTLNDQLETLYSTVLTDGRNQ